MTPWPGSTQKWGGGGNARRYHIALNPKMGVKSKNCSKNGEEQASSCHMNVKNVFTGLF